MEQYQKTKHNMQKLVESYQPIIDMVNKSILPNLQDDILNLQKQAVAIQRSFVIDESLKKSLMSIRDITNKAMPIDDETFKNLQFIMKSVRPSEELIKASKAFMQDSFTEVVRGIEGFDFNPTELVEEVDIDYEEDEGLEDLFSKEDEMQTLKEGANNTAGPQEKVANRVEVIKKKHYILIFIIMFFWNNFAAPYFQDNIGKPVMAQIVSKVRELPEATSKIINEINDNVRAIIIENVSYYYKIRFVNESGENIEGYVAKKNLRLLDENN